MSTCRVPGSLTQPREALGEEEPLQQLWVRWELERWDAPASSLECSGLGFLGGKPGGSLGPEEG